MSGLTLLNLQQPFTTAGFPVSEQQLTPVVEAVLARILPAGEYELTVRIVDLEESQSLNHQFRHKDRPTNILSFPSDILDLPEEIRNSLPATPLGDLVICLPVVQQEATTQDKQPDHHLTHMLVHGCLHLCGFDHEQEDEAEEMEQLECNILAGFGIQDPYQ